MIIIGEKINGTIPSVGEAIANHNEELIRDLAIRQSDAGADYIDIAAGTATEIEEETMCWMIDLVQEATDKPLCIDSPNPALLAKLYPRVKNPGLINSISLEGEKCEILLPVLKDNPEWGVVALCCDQSGVAETADIKVQNALTLIEKAAEYGISPERMHIDPLVLALSAAQNAAIEFLDAIRRIKKAYPTVNVTAALSNVSFGMPVRKIVNTNFLALCMEAGLDSVIADPLNKPVMETIYATNAILGKDRLCRKYNTAYRKGIIGTKPVG